MLKRFALASRPGAYLRIVEEGEVGAGDAIEVLGPPEHGVTVATVADAIQLDETLLPETLEATQLPGDLHRWLAARAN